MWERRLSTFDALTRNRGTVLEGSGAESLAVDLELTSVNTRISRTPIRIFATIHA